MKQKRRVLFQALRDELTPLYAHPEEGFDPDSSYFRAPIHLAVPNRLFDGETLDYKSHAKLIQALLRFQAATSNYNEIVTVANLDQISSSPTSTRVLFDFAHGLNKVVLRSRDEVLSLLPK